MVLVGVWHMWPLSLARMVADLDHQHGHVLTVWPRGPRHKIVVVADASDNSLLGARGRILWQLGLGSIYRGGYPVRL